MAESTWMKINIENLDSLRETNFVQFLPEEIKIMIRRIYSKIVNKNNLVDMNVRAKLRSTQARIVITNPEQTIVTPIESVIADIRREIEATIAEVLLFLESLNKT